MNQEFNHLCDHSNTSFNTSRVKKRWTNNSPFAPSQPYNTSPTATQCPNTTNYCGGANRGCNQNNKNNPFSNKIKNHMNLLYCYSCGYDVNHSGYNCPNPKA